MVFKSFMENMILFELQDVVGKENVSINAADKLIYGVDYFWTSRMWVDKGGEAPKADYIVRPASAKEISKVLVIANYYKLPVHIWGGGSGAQGSALPMAGGIVLDTKRMNRLIDLSEKDRTITAESGMIFQTLESYANERGFSVMHIPSCITCGTVGGALAHRGIGIMSTKYGKIDDQCISLEAVLPNGEIIHTLPIPKHAAGPDLLQVLVGSEGTLGVITKATFKLVRLPEKREFRGLIFKDLTTGISACREIVQRLKPSILRLYDEAETASFIKKIVGVSEPGVFVNLAVEGDIEIVEIEIKRILEICQKYEGKDTGPEYGEKWYENRVTFFYPGFTLENPKMWGTMDTAATYENIEKVYWAMKKAIEENYPQARFIAHFSHWYDWGTMIYDRFIIDNPPEDPEEALRLNNEIWNTGVRAAMQNGGIINDHHGVGLKLSRLMKEQYGPAMQILSGLKKSLDPNGIMNPYKLGL